MITEDCEMTRLSYEELRQNFKDSVYFAARDGYAISLVALLNEIDDWHLQNELINQEFIEDDGQIFTPFIIAAKNGKYNVVFTLLMKFKPDLEKECVIKFDGHIVSGATALWCAAGSGHMNVVKLLVKHGANVNHKTKAHSTPLRAACFDGRMDIVQYLVTHGADINLANAYNNTCLMISAYKGHTDVVEYLLSIGSDPNEQALCGATALHYAAECGHVEICSALLDHGAVLKLNEYGMTPVIVAAERTREAVVHVFSTRPHLLSRRETINALELMGASFANDKDNYNVAKAYQYLMHAMELRYADVDDVIKKNLAPPIPAYENWVESQTIQDLQAIRYNSNSIHMESLTIRERILGRKCPEVAHPIVFRGAVCADNGRFDRCESLWMHALEIRQENNLSVQRDLLRFAQVFSQMIHINAALRVSNILKVSAACIVELERNKQKMAKPGPKDDVEVIAEEYEQNIVTVLYLLTILTKVLKRPNQRIQNSDIAALYKLVFTLSKMNLKLRDGQTLLHLAVNGVTPVDDFHTNDVCRFPCVDTVKLLLHCGANVSECDCDRNTPLHILASTLQTARSNEHNDIITTIEEIIKLFVESGIHLDAVNNDGLTAAQLCTSHLIESLVKSYEMQLINLKCLASRCITCHKLKYRGLVPQHLENFIQLHSAEKFAD